MFKLFNLIGGKDLQLLMKINKRIVNKFKTKQYKIMGKSLHLFTKKYFCCKGMPPIFFSWCEAPEIFSKKILQKKVWLNDILPSFLSKILEGVGPLVNHGFFCCPTSLPEIFWGQKISGKVFARDFW